MKLLVLAFLFNFFHCYAQIPTNSISSHVLDIANGHPARGIKILAYYLDQTNDNWRLIGNTTTDNNGRVAYTHPGFDLVAATYKFRFEVEDYFTNLNQQTFYSFIEVHDATQHYHVPITLSNWGYSTYRGS